MKKKDSMITELRAEIESLNKSHATLKQAMMKKDVALKQHNSRAAVERRRMSRSQLQIAAYTKTLSEHKLIVVAKMKMKDMQTNFSMYVGTYISLCVTLFHISICRFPVPR